MVHFLVACYATLWTAMLVGRDIVITWDKNRQNSMVIPQVTLRLRSGYFQVTSRLLSGYSQVNFWPIRIFSSLFYRWWNIYNSFSFSFLFLLFISVICFLCQFCCRRRRRRRFRPFFVFLLIHRFVKINVLSDKFAAVADTDADFETFFFSFLKCSILRTPTPIPTPILTHSSIFFFKWHLLMPTPMLMLRGSYTLQRRHRRWRRLYTKIYGWGPCEL